jgi:SNF2 family DNA or RNA helicase
MAGIHNVYVVELDKKVLDRKKVRDLNPSYNPDKPPLYVGMSGLSAEERFKKHKEGLKANTWVKNHGLKLRPEFHKNRLSFFEAEKAEELLAKKLRRQGYPVIGGNRQLSNRAIKKADWTEFDKERDANMPPQQARVVRKINQPGTRGLVLFHSTGSGKTKSSIEAYKSLKMPTDVVVPAALQENYRKELRKWTGSVPRDVNIVSQQRLANPTLKTPMYDKGLQIVDEVQKARNPNSQLYQALQRTHPKKRLLLSGTPLYNNPADLANIVNLAAGKDVLPSSPGAFNQKYFKQEEVSPGILGKLMGVKPGVEQHLQNRDELKKVLDKYVDYYAAPHEGYPSVTEKEVAVPMGQHQQDIYNSIMGKAPWWVRWKVRNGLPPGKGELEPMRAFLGGVRQVSNTTSGFTTRKNELQQPKIDNAFRFLKQQMAKDPSYKGVVYSNYLQSGLKPYEQLLQKNNIPYGEFSGAVNPAQREQMVRDYNANKIRALLISSAGAEGLDLRGTRLIQMLDPHFNVAKEKQIIGRGARFHSHDDLPADKQNLLVQRYLAQPQPSFWDRMTFNKQPGGVDQYIRALANRKEQMNDEILHMMTEGDQNYWSRNPLS